MITCTQTEFKYNGDDDPFIQEPINSQYIESVRLYSHHGSYTKYFGIEFHMVSGSHINWKYKNETERDKQYNEIIKL